MPLWSKKKSSGNTDYQRARDRADEWMSKFIRLRDADASGYGRCISCGKLVHWSEADNGHFINRGHLNTRYDEQNCNLQCRSCNRFDEGNNEGYRRGLIAKYGEEVVNHLYLKKHIFRKYSVFELKAIADYFREKFNELKKIKNWKK